MSMPVHFHGSLILRQKRSGMRSSIGVWDLKADTWAKRPWTESITQARSVMAEMRERAWKKQQPKEGWFRW